MELNKDKIIYVEAGEVTFLLSPPEHRELVLKNPKARIDELLYE